jgi:signal transduction histidine kinase/CheY-like chemotaxis protein
VDSAAAPQRETRRRSGRRRLLRYLLFPPARFEEAMEADFRAERAREAAGQRRAAMVLVLAIWVTYFAWDVLHSYRNKDVSQLFQSIFLLRLAGAFCAAAAAVAVGWYAHKQRVVTLLLAACMCMLFALAVAMVAVSPFPYNYQFYYICLPLIMILMLALFGRESRIVYALSGFCVVASFAGLEFAEISEWAPDAVKSFDYLLFPAWNYYFLAGMAYLLSFALVGCAVSVELERTARAAFRREHMLSDANRELEALNAALRASERETQVKTSALIKAKDEMRALAERQNVAKSKFLADAAHDLRQPMQALTNLLEAADHALERGDSAKCAEVLDLAQDASRLTRSSFNAVLEISRLESGFVQADYSVFDLAELVEETIAPCLVTAAEQGIEVRQRWHRGRPIRVRSDRHLLARVIGNIVSNAIKYSDPAKGERRAVIVGIVRCASRVRIDVVDNGLGIPEPQWGRVFQPFVQLHNQERDREKGVGLGLSIVNAIIPLLSEHRLDMRSTEGRGTRFSIDVPLALPGPAETRIIARPVAALPDLSGAYVLYVEDDALVRKSTTALLDSYGIRHEALASYAELERLLPTMERPPDVIITDYRLPDGRTAEDVMKLASATFEEQLPLIVMTGEMVSVGRGWSAKVLRKPVSPEMLIAEIGSAAPG